MVSDFKTGRFLFHSGSVSRLRGEGGIDTSGPCQQSGGFGFPFCGLASERAFSRLALFN